MSPSGSGGGSSTFRPTNADGIFNEFFGSGSRTSRPSNADSRPTNADGIFNEFFGSRSSEAGNSRVFQSAADNFGAFGEGIVPRKAPPLETKLLCSLEELYSGSTRKMKISRTVVSCHGRQVKEEEVLNIDVKAGWKKGTKITYPNKGDEHPDQLPADVVFIIDEKPHDTYTRDGNDLIINKRVSLGEALGGTTVNITTLDGRNLSIPVNDIITPGYETVVPREGMPIAKEPGKRGILRVKFEVKFPARLAPELRARLQRDLSG